MKDGLILIKDREREELDAAIRNFGGKITQLGSCAEYVPKKSTPKKKTRAEIDIGLKRRFSALANRVKVGFEVCGIATRSLTSCWDWRLAVHRSTQMPETKKFRQRDS